MDGWKMSFLLGFPIGVSPTCLLNSWTFRPAIRLFHPDGPSTLRSPCRFGSSDAVNGPWTNQDGKMKEFVLQRWCHWSDMVIWHQISYINIWYVYDTWSMMTNDIWCKFSLSLSLAPSNVPTEGARAQTSRKNTFSMYIDVWYSIWSRITVKRFSNEMWYYYISYDRTQKKKKKLVTSQIGSLESIKAFLIRLALGLSL